jgi:hypothetical protein
MRRPFIEQSLLLTNAIVLALTLVGCSISSGIPRKPITSSPSSGQTSPPHMQTAPIPMQVGTLSPMIDTISQQVLDNIEEHGWNANAEMKGKVTGGLFINWEMNNPSRTNALNEGIGDATAAMHDPQVDLFYLNALAEYQTLHPQDTRYAGEIQKATQLIIHEFANYNLPKGWIYFYILRDGQLLHNDDLVNIAYTIANHYYTRWYDPKIGMVYNRAHHPGVYDPEQSIMTGAALIEAGMRWQKTDWVKAGQSTLHKAVQYSLDPDADLFYNDMTIQDNGQQLVANYQAKPATQGSIVEALVTAYTLTHDSHYLAVAGQVLQGLFRSNLMDRQNGGMYFAKILSTGVLQKNYKETRAHIHVLIGLLQYNRALQSLHQSPRFMDEEQQLITLLTTRFYQSQYHGYFYRMTPTYQIYDSAKGQGIGVEDFFTTEAMASALDALQQTEFVNLAF